MPELEKKSEEKANKLTALFRQTFPRKELRVVRPVKCTELRVQGSPRSGNRGGDCRRFGGSFPREDLQPEVLRMPLSGTGDTFWLRCPTAVAKKVTTGGRIRVEWASAAVNILPARPTQCFSCLRIGHVTNPCSEREAPSFPIYYKCGERAFSLELDGRESEVPALRGTRPFSWTSHGGAVLPLSSP